MRRLDRDGYALADLVFTDTFCDEVITAIPEVDVGRVLNDRRFRDMLASFVPGEVSLVRATVADDSGRWHQDLGCSLVVRVHLEDGCAWRLVPQSHRNGVLSEERLTAVVASNPHVELAAPRGAMLFMHPLLVHARSPASRGRTLQIELTDSG